MALSDVKDRKPAVVQSVSQRPLTSLWKKPFQDWDHSSGGAHSSEQCSASEECAGVDCPLLPLPESAEVKLCCLCPLVLVTLAR